MSLRSTVRLETQAPHMAEREGSCWLTHPKHLTDQFVRLGKAGYHDRLSAIVQVAERLTQALRDLGFMILSKADGVRGIPIVAFRLKPGRKLKFDEFVLSEKLQRLGWLVPAYHMADGASGIKLLRVVCRVDFTQELCDLFVRQIGTTLKECIT